MARVGDARLISTTRSRRSTTSGRRGDGMTPFARVAAARLAPARSIAKPTRRARAGRDRPRAARPRLRHRDAAGRACGATHPGWRLAGVDASAGMLAVARAQAARPPATSTWVARAQLGAPLPFAGARSTSARRFYDTLNHLPDTPALARAFAAAAAVLRPGACWSSTSPAASGSRTGGAASNDLHAAPAGAWPSTRGFDRGDRDRDRRRDARARRAHRPLPDPRALLRRGRDRRRAAGAAGFAVEHDEAWSPFPIGGLGKTWWVARLG